MTKRADPRTAYKLTPERAQIVIDNVRTDLSVTNAARIARLSPQTPLNWITQGREDKSNGLDTIYTQFLDDFYEAQGLKVREFMRDVATMNKGWQAVAWLLEKCCAEDFGKDSELYKELLTDYKMLMQSIIDQNKGVNHGNETSISKTL
jgi:hypothetical protein